MQFIEVLRGYRLRPVIALERFSRIRCHHLIKTFWGWRDRQLPDGAVIWDLPGGRSYVTTPGSAWLFPHLSVPTGSLPIPSPDTPAVTACMPKRKTTRAQDRAHRITTERNANRIDRQTRQAAAFKTNPPPQPDDDPPPF